MKKHHLIGLLIFLAPALSIGQTYFALRERIVPLRSSRADVEKLARFVKDAGNFVEYELSGKKLEVYYAEAECRTFGWKVPKDTVIEFVYHPSPNELSYDQIKSTFASVEVTDDTKTRSIVDRKKSVLYFSRAGHSDVERVVFMPPAGYSKLRCQGLPEYDPARTYSWFQRLRIEDPERWDPDEVYPTIFSSGRHPSPAVTIFIYCKKGEEPMYRMVRKSIETFAKLTMGPVAKRIKIAFGGYRETLQVETFVLPREYPPVIRTPTRS